MDKIGLSVFFPCYNEEANVERTTLAALEVCRSITDDFEIIIVDDGSKDRTGELADQLAEQHEKVRAIHNRPNRGYGGALQAGFGAAQKEWVFYTDGDGQFDFKELPKLLDLLDKYEIVSAYRLNRNDPTIRRINGWGWSMLCNLLLGMKIRDIDCAFKIFPHRLFDEIEMRSEGALIDAEILAKATHRGYKIGQVGVYHYPRTAGQQTGANLKVIARAFKELLQLRKQILAEKKS
ncbi:MAG: glycosyltransferase family 2 protein [Planctomycetota bacterium]|nr:MAG: glycosyltransferase family 2 protein [Planctomycetota bacterium]